MEMQNCLKWSHAGATYMACDFGTFIQVRRSIEIDLLSNTPADETGIRLAEITSSDDWSRTVVLDGHRFTLRPQNRNALTVTAPTLIATTLVRWLERTTPSSS